MKQVQQAADAALDNPCHSTLLHLSIECAKAAKEVDCEVVSCLALHSFFFSISNSIDRDDVPTLAIGALAAQLAPLLKLLKNEGVGPVSAPQIKRFLEENRSAIR